MCSVKEKKKSARPLEDKELSCTQQLRSGFGCGRRHLREVVTQQTKIVSLIVRKENLFQERNIADRSLGISSVDSEFRKYNCEYQGSQRLELIRYNLIEGEHFLTFLASRLAV